MIDRHALIILEFDKIRSMLTAQALTPYGAELCEEIQPSTEFSKVKDLQQETDDAVKIFCRYGTVPMQHCPDIRMILVKADNQAVLTCGELLQTGLFLDSLEKIVRYEADIDESLDPGNRCLMILRRIKPEHELKSEIFRCISPDEELYDHASPLLMSIRTKIRHAKEDVKKSLEAIVRGHPKELQEQLITLRGDRYVLMVKTEHKSKIPGIIHDTSSSKATLFVEPFAVVEHNNRIREYLSAQRDEMERILIELSTWVERIVIDLRKNAEAIGEIDYMMAKAKLSDQMNARIPHLNDRSVLRLIDARHPLIPAEKVVPISIAAGDSYKTLLITGPNTGGKTVALKTCGLLTLMTMAGLQIPAKEASEISVFCDIYADIGDEQSIEQNLSTFSSHIKNLITIISAANSSMLVLADELGAGTEPSSGAALAIAILERLKEAGCITIATTHYKELKHYAMTTPDVENASCEFDLNTLMPTFKIRTGLPGSSNAFEIAKRLGLPENIIDDARSRLDSGEKEFEQMIAETEHARIIAEKNKQSAQEELTAAQKERQELEKMKILFEVEQKNMLIRSKKTIQEYLDNTYDELSELLEEAKKSLKEKDLEQARNELMEIRGKLKSRQTSIGNEIAEMALSDDKNGQIPHMITLGETYFSGLIQTKGILVELNQSKQSCILLDGNRRVEVPVSSLRIPCGTARAGNQDRKRRKPLSKQVTMEKKEKFSFEIKLIGLTADEALERLDKFLDDAVITGVVNIRVVHGKGSGILRSAVSRFLRNDKRVKEFRLGTYGEGDSGVTIVTLG